MATGPEIAAGDLPAPMAAPTPSKPKTTSLRALRHSWLAEEERGFLLRIIGEAPTVQEAAKRAGISAATLYRLLRRHGIKLKTVAVSAS